MSTATETARIGVDITAMAVALCGGLLAMSAFVDIPLESIGLVHVESAQSAPDILARVVVGVALFAGGCVVSAATKPVGSGI